MGKNYPTALSCALEDLTGKRIDSPNDLLGISYIKTILKNNYNIKPEIIKRTNNYHEKKLESDISSATAIREAIKNNQSIKNEIPYSEKNYFKPIYQWLNFAELKVKSSCKLIIY